MRERMVTLHMTLLFAGLFDLGNRYIDRQVIDGSIGYPLPGIPNTKVYALISKSVTEIGAPNSEPYLELCMDYEASVLNAQTQNPQACRYTHFPCLLLQHFGPYVTAADAVWKCS